MASLPPVPTANNATVGRVSDSSLHCGPVSPARLLYGQAPGPASAVDYPWETGITTRHSVNAELSYDPRDRVAAVAAQPMDRPPAARPPGFPGIGSYAP